MTRHDVNVRFSAGDEERARAEAEAAQHERNEINFGLLRCGSGYVTRIHASDYGLETTAELQYPASSVHGDLALHFVDGDLEIALSAKIPGRFCEEVRVGSGDAPARMLRIKASMMPVNMGTPSLRANIHCISHGGRDESESSDGARL